MKRNESAENMRNMRAYYRKVTASKEEAIAALKRAGILTESGEVEEIYRGLLMNKYPETLWAFWCGSSGPWFDKPKQVRWN